MNWLQLLDLAGFRYGNDTLTNPVFDVLMPFASGNPFFIPVVSAIALALLWKGGVRGRLFVVCFALLLLIGDSLIVNGLKHLIARPRPFLTLEDVHLRVGRGYAGSMPSGHAANWFGALALTWMFYRRSWWFMLPLAATVAFSRVYVGVHYPSDVLTGAALGFSYGLGLVWVADRIWSRAGPRWFPKAWAKLPGIRHRAELTAVNDASSNALPAGAMPSARALPE